MINRYEWFWKFPKLHEPLSECNLRIFKITSTYYSWIVWEGCVIFYLQYIQQNCVVSMETYRYSYGVQFGINCTALDQSKLGNFVECTNNSFYRLTCIVTSAIIIIIMKPPDIYLETLEPTMKTLSVYLLDSFFLFEIWFKLYILEEIWKPPKILRCISHNKE